MVWAGVCAVIAAMLVTITGPATFAGIRRLWRSGIVTNVVITSILVTIGTFSAMLAFVSALLAILPWFQPRCGTISCNIAGATLATLTSGAKTGPSTSGASARHLAMVWQTTSTLRRMVGGPFWSSQLQNPLHLARFTALLALSAAPRRHASVAHSAMATLPTL